jgi:hypothetical protein
VFRPGRLPDPLESCVSNSRSNLRLAILLGQVPFVLHFPERRLFERAGQRYAAFQVPDATGLPVYLESTSPLPQAATQFVYTLHDTSSLCLDSEAAHFRGVRHEYALDSLLRVLLSVTLLPRRGFLLHAATVVRNGRAYVFTGRSGAGKSTVAALSPPGAALTDEISLLRFSDGAWRAHGTPFWGAFRAAGSNRRVPVAGIYSLTKAPEDRLERLPVKQALRALLPNVLFFSTSPRENETLLQLLADATEQIPVYRLRFRRHAAFWEVIER